MTAEAPDFPDDTLDDAYDGAESAGQPSRTAVVPDTRAGRRFDAVLAELFPEFSRSRLSAWIKSGDVLLDGEVVRPRESLRGGEVVTLTATLETQTADLPEDIPLNVLHEDDEVLVIDKPAGMVVHPGAGNRTGTLVNALLFRDPALALVPRAGVVHRLDKDTSGVMVIARTLQAHTALVAQLSARDVHRQYVAVVVGPMVSGGTVDAPIDRHSRDRLKMAVQEGGRDAVTHYRVRERYRAHTALECRLETGRTHQIRVHMQSIRHPIVGDPLYGGALKLPKAATDDLVATLRGFRRQALHAETLEFVHPSTGEPLRVSAPIPEDMQRLMRILKEDTLQFRANSR